MNKIYFALMLILGLLFTCSNESVESNNSITVSFSNDSFNASEDDLFSEVPISIEVVGGITPVDNLISLTYVEGNADFNDISNVLPIEITIPAGDYTTMSTFDIILTIVDDDIDEETENFMLSLSSESENVVTDTQNQFNITIADNDITVELQGLEYELINYIVEEPMDLNNDGIFSTDLLQEGIICVMDTIEFGEENMVDSPTLRTTGLEVIGNTQIQHCLDGDGAQFNYVLDDGIIDLSFLGQYYYSGVLSDDIRIIEFDIPFEYIVGMNVFGRNEYISENNGIQFYTGGVIAIYEVIE